MVTHHSEKKRSDFEMIAELLYEFLSWIIGEIMRVIAGKARRIQLNTIRGNDTRPTTDRIKETLFNMISPLLYDINFLDLFSGSGAIGRGAKKATMVEKTERQSNAFNQI